jgi:ribosome-binding protein aMBF1 (putative translation factor)
MLRSVCRFWVVKKCIFCSFSQSNDMADILFVLGENVRTERIRQGLSQEELADKAGFHRTYIGMIERAERNITLRNLERLAEALDLSITDVITPKS